MNFILLLKVFLFHLNSQYRKFGLKYKRYPKFQILPNPEPVIKIFPKINAINAMIYPNKKDRINADDKGSDIIMYMFVRMRRFL